MRKRCPIVCARPRREHACLQFLADNQSGVAKMTEPAGPGVALRTGGEVGRAGSGIGGGPGRATGPWFGAMGGPGAALAVLLGVSSGGDGSTATDRKSVV